MKQCFMKSFNNPARLTGKLFKAATRCTAPRGNARLRPGLKLAMACGVAFVLAAPLGAQQHKNKIPIVGKIKPFAGRQAYTGTIRSVDMKQKILNVNSRKGKESEIFPIKKGVHVESLSGEKLEVNALTPGTSVLIYYQEKSGARQVKNIIVLESGKKESKQAPAS